MRLFNILPAGVSCIGRELRLKSGASKTFSSLWMAVETAGCETLITLAAPAVLPVLAVQRKARRAEISGRAFLSSIIHLVIQSSHRNRIENSLTDIPSHATMLLQHWSDRTRHSTSDGFKAWHRQTARKQGLRRGNKLFGESLPQGFCRAPRPLTEGFKPHSADGDRLRSPG